MMQGDSYNLEIEILDADGVAVTDSEVLDVEITIGFLRKTYAKHEVTYSEALGKWLFPITQEESFKLPATGVKAQVRVAWNTGGVEGVSLGCVHIDESTSKEVL